MMHPAPVVHPGPDVVITRDPAAPVRVTALPGLVFTETITTPGDADAVGRITEAHAVTLLRQSLSRQRLRARVEATRTGGALITWTRHRLDGDAVIPVPCSITLTPITPLKITPTVRQDLRAVDRYPDLAALDLHDDPRRDGHARITSGLYSIPPAASERLLDAGLLIAGEPEPVSDRWGRVGTRTPVSLSLGARLALHSWEHSAERHDQQARLYARSSWPTCPCGWATWADDASHAARLAREHRQNETAALIATL